ncbi:MAG: glycosyltransferase family 2 protein [Saprospiraceae bacterium]|nr:glycosyltransferase family 2 protein [Saprospiraceae bacterium]MDW8230210.1 glycosyltransferase family 2 protein [Saprospiraceae bacterium]
MPISAVIITYNEARNIERCITSLQGVADEIIVLDSYSTDETPDLCRQLGVRFLQHPFDGYGQQKNRANAMAQHPWILSLDADEALSAPLREALLAQRERLDDADAYAMHRRTNYCGHWVKHCGWYPDRKVRLFRRDLAQWNTSPVHEQLLLPPNARIGFLNGDLLHYSYYSTDEHRERARKYARLSAQAMKQAGKRAYPWTPYLRAAFKWLRNYILLSGFLDGRTGWDICRISAMETFWKYRFLQRDNHPEDA